MDELALTITSDGAGYQRRVELARMAISRRPGDARIAAGGWVRVAVDGARAWERQFGTYGETKFSTMDILRAAVELADYYATHLAEMEP
jgi:hypothetical protein